MNKEAIDTIIEKKPSLKSYRAKLEEMKTGAYCMHRSWGLGEIKDYDAATNRLIIDFGQGKQAHAMDPAFCVDKLEILPENHIIVHYQKDKASVQKLIRDEPVSLIADILSTARNKTLASSELEDLLKYLMEEESFKKWWSATKKLLVKDPRIAVPAKKNGNYTLRETPITPEQEILEEFYLNHHPLKRIALAEKLYQLSDSVEEIAQDLPQILQELTEAIREAHQLKQAERLYGCWIRNDLARHLHTDVDALLPTSSSIILAADDLCKLAEELPNHYYPRFLDLITRVYPDQWQKVCLNLLKNSTGKFTHECIVFLLERGCEELVATSLKRWLNEQNIKAPVLHWIVKNRHSTRFNKIIEGLLTPRLLSAVFYAVDLEALQIATNRRIPLADLVSDDQELITDLLAEVSSETAKDLAQMLLLNQGFELLTKRSILARFIRHFPSIQSLVAGDSEKQNEQLVVSQESFEARKKEYEILITQKLPENKQAIATAREHGDLRENSEYKMARQDQETLLARKAQLETEMSRARVSDFSEARTDCVGIGSIVSVVEGSSGRKHRYAILGAWDSDPDKNILSYKTPLGQSLLSKKVGENVKVKVSDHEETWTVASIERWVDQNIANTR